MTADEIKNHFIKGGHARLNSGGPTMTISDVHPDGIVETVWFNEAGDARRDAFHVEELVILRGGIRPIQQFHKTALNEGWIA